MSSVASIPLRYSSMNGSKFPVKTGFLPLLYDLFVLAKVLVLQSYLCMPMDDIATLTSDVSSVGTHSNLILTNFGCVVALYFSTSLCV